MKTEISLKDLAKSKNWVEDINIARIKLFEPDAIYAKATLQKGGKTAYITFRVGMNVAKKLKIKSGDRINVLHHPDDILSFLLIKSSSRSGYIIKHEYKSTTILRLALAWKRPLVLTEFPYTKMDYIHLPQNDGILFRIPQ